MATNDRINDCSCYQGGQPLSGSYVRVFTNNSISRSFESTTEPHRNVELHDRSCSICHKRIVIKDKALEKRNNLSDDDSENLERDSACSKYRSCQGNNCCLSSNLVSGDCVHLPSTSNEPSGPIFVQNRQDNICLQNVDDPDDNSSSDTGNDDYSLGSEDGCIYTYRGGALEQNNIPNLIHLPNNNLNNVHENERASSPEMDFLEMDFDPEPSCEADSIDETPEDIIIDNLDCIPPPFNAETHNMPKLSNNNLDEVKPDHNSSQLPVTLGNEEDCNPWLSPSQPNFQPHSSNEFLLHKNSKGQIIHVKRTRLMSPTHCNVYQNYHSDVMIQRSKSGETSQCSENQEYLHCVGHPEDEINLSSALYHCTMGKKLILDKASTSFVPDTDISNLECDTDKPLICEVERTMIWSESEAYEKQVTQIGTSACGATALINVFLALGISVNLEKIKAAVGTRQRANNAPLPRYLLSRSCAGCTEMDLVRAITLASDNLLRAKFFPCHPEPSISLSHWLADWITLGAIPILTMNLQKGPLTENGELPDAWHHQMVFGVSPRGIFLCNPMQCVPEELLWPQLCSESELLIRQEDVLKRWTPDTELSVLGNVAQIDTRWKRMNVLGQVVGAVRGTGSSRGVLIPCAYRAGITLAAPSNSRAYKALSV